MIQSIAEQALHDDDPTLVAPVITFSRAAPRSLSICHDLTWHAELADDPTLVTPVAAFAKVVEEAASVQRDSEPAPQFVPATPAEPVASDMGREGTAEPARFTGTLDDLSVADVVQILQLAKKGAVLRVRHEGNESQLWCSGGLIVDAESGRLRGEAAVHRILGLESGSMVADFRAQPRERKIFAATPQLLFEAARRKDESVELRRRLGGELRCYRVGALAPADATRMNAVERSLLDGFSSTQTLREAIDASAFAEVETLTAVSRCIGAGYLVDAGIRGAQRSAPAGERSRGRARSSLDSAAPAKPSPGRWRAISRLCFAAVLVPAGMLPLGYLVGRSAAQLLAPPEAIARAAAAGQEDRSTLRAELLELRVEPPRAEVWLDARLEPLPSSACPDPLPSRAPSPAEPPALLQRGDRAKFRRAVPASLREAPHSAAPKPRAAGELGSRRASEPRLGVVEDSSVIIRTVDF
ncbi:MAG: DUF4388 domain-containing protein [Deltaproteobacteria bacterium]